MKARRHIKILEIIRQHPVETQEELAERLKLEGIHVTQATVCRDIKELGLVKVPAGNGRSRYAQPDDPVAPALSDRMLRLFRDCIVDMDYSENMLVIWTLPATAAAVAEGLDSLHWKEILGTLAGERNVFVVCKPREAAPQVLERLRRLAQ